ncbi:hypothetical protein RHSIM_Rhsim08G0181500 [Rhododendron simsii]|uniref:Uncharacterized protein n=1 Tax=Rhododendron simsii TaxID=118357 RepID=A0A834LFW0_RHOSS|nr:hypothetical protein RHSIM_Rhsim08G0181500 [Rhododendron simsii]
MRRVPQGWSRERITRHPSTLVWRIFPESSRDESGSDRTDEAVSQTEAVLQTESEAIPERVSSSPVAAVRRSTRVPNPNPKYLSSLDYLLLTDNGEPSCYDEALQDMFVGGTDTQQPWSGQ